jgi:hypothetical protein
MQVHSIAPLLSSDGIVNSMEVENTLQQVLCSGGVTIDHDSTGYLARALLAKYLMQVGLLVVECLLKYNYVMLRGLHMGGIMSS